MFKRIGVAGATSAAVALMVFLGLVSALTPPRITPPAQSDLVISDVTVLNPGLSRAEHQTLILRRGQIVSIRPSQFDDPAPICPNCFAMPGLIDAHVHTPTRLIVGNQRLFSLMYLAHGVTSVRDLGQSDDSVTRWAALSNRGLEAGPHVYRCGRIIDGREPGWPSAISATTPEEGRVAVRQQVAEGVNCIKVYNHVDQPTFQAIAAAAAEANMPLVGHVPHLVGLRRVSNFEAQHLTGFPYLHRQAPWGNDIAPADLVTMTEGEIDEALALTRTRHVSLTPTISTFQARLTASDPVRYPPPASARYLPDFWGRAWKVLVPHPEGADAIARQAASVASVRHISAKARLLGIDVLAGTDTVMPWAVPGDAMLQEIDQLAAAYGDKEAALAAATVINGRHIDPGHIGVLAPGARADLLLLTDDPTKDLTTLRRARVVIADGRRFDRAFLDTWLTRYQKHFRGALYARAFDPVARMLERKYGSHLVIDTARR